MRINYKSYTLVFFVVINCFAKYAIAQNLDSLSAIYQNKKLHDSIRIQALDDIVWNQLFLNPDTALKLANIELDYSIKIGNKKYTATAYQNLGGCYFYKADYKNAEQYYKKSLSIYSLAKNYKGIASVYNNLGIVYEVTYQYNKAVDAYLKSISIQEKEKNYLEISKTYTNIGNIYAEIKEYKYALEYFRKSINICRKANDVEGIAESYNNLAILYNQMGNHDSSIYLNRYSINICLEKNNLQCAATAINNLGMELLEQKQYDSALVYFEKSVELNKKIGDEFSMIRSKKNIGKVYLEKKQYAKAKEILLEALKFSHNIGGVDIVKECYYELYLLHHAEGNSQLALKYHLRYITLRDSLNEARDERELNRKKLEYEYHSKAFADSIKSKAEKEVINAKLSNAETKKKYLYLVIVIILVFSGFVFERFRKTRKQNVIIANQKLILEAKQKEILDSINYAKQLQNAILPSSSTWSNLIAESFILYLPKDIVAGDFYWIESIDNTVLVAAADCTGHGVPGAMVSVVCANALKRAVKEFNLIDPGLILNKTRDLIIETFEKSEAEVKDGMDISLIAISRNQIKSNNEFKETTSDSKIKIQWSGANNPLWIVKHQNNVSSDNNHNNYSILKTENSNYALFEVKPDKQPVGKFANAKPFTTNELLLDKDDMLYLFTDGLADQFGGKDKNTRGKKLKSPTIQKTILEIQNSSLDEQKNALLTLFNEWKGDLEQIDDICIIGIKI